MKRKMRKSLAVILAYVMAVCLTYTAVIPAYAMEDDAAHLVTTLEETSSEEKESQSVEAELPAEESAEPDEEESAPVETEAPEEKEETPDDAVTSVTEESSEEVTSEETTVPEEETLPETSEEETLPETSEEEETLPETSEEETETPAETPEETEEETTVEETTALEEETEEETKAPEQKTEKELPPVHALLGSETITTEYLAASGATYTVKAAFSSDSNIPAGAVLRIKEYDQDSPEYAAAKAKILAAMKAQDSTFDEASFRMAALDIAIVGADGKEIEPDVPVEISIKMKKLPSGVSVETLNQTMEVQHLDTSTGRVVVETVADADDVKVSGTTAEAEFTVDSFSVFALTWTDGSTSIHWGTLDSDGSFNEFDAASLDTSVGSVDLRASYSGYEYVDAVYYTSEPSAVSIDHSESIEGRTFINDVITKVEGTGDSYTWTAEDAQNAAIPFTLETGSHIYVVYQVPTGTTPHTPDEGEIPAPTTEKTVTPNLNPDGTNDGTYTIEIDITGNQIKETEQKGANVVIVFDNSNSMITNRIGNRTRLAVAQDAVGILINTLNPGTNDIDMSLVYFGTTATTASFTQGSWTKNGSDITRVVNGLTASGTASYGTNWMQALQQAYNLASNPPDTDPTYVIFITDGCPSVNSYDNNNDSHGAAGTNNTSDPCYVGGLAYAKAIAGEKGTNYSTTATWRYNGRNYSVTTTEGGAGANLYGIYTGTDNTNLLNTLISSSNGKASITATSEEAINAAFKNIAQTIVNNLGATGVTTTDGVTELSSVSADVQGAAGAFEYYRKGGKNEDGTEKYSSTANGGLGETWSDAPGAIYNDDGSVTWDLSSVGMAEADVTYVLRFTVWPSQEAYDLIANLNNGTVDFDDLDASVQDQLVESGGKYSLKTNTTLNTSYTFNGQTYTDDIAFEQGSMILNETKMKVKKEFSHAINEQDPYAEIDFYLLVDGEYYQTDGTTSETFDEDLVYTMTVNKDNLWTEEVFIAPGVMKDGQVLETGHKYTLEEKIVVGNEYEYQFTPQTVRPMNINGTLTYLVLVDKYNPAPDGADTYVIDDEEYFASTEAEGALVGTNRKTAELDITKMIVDKTGEFTTAQLDAETFTYRVTLTVPADADLSGITAYEYVPRYDQQPSATRFTIFGYQSEEPEGVQGISTDVDRFNEKIYGAYTVTTSTANRQMTDMFTEDEGGETMTATIDITLKRNEIIRFTNLPADTTYTIVEMYNNFRSADPSRDADAGGSTQPSNIAERGYTTTVATKSRNPVEDTVRTGTVEGTTVTGTIDYLDVRYYNQFTNTLNDVIDVELTGIKHLEGYEWSGERYYFNLARAEGEPETTPLPLIGAQGRVRFYLSNPDGTDDKSYSFGRIRFSEAGTYTYTIAEDDPGAVAVINGTVVEYGAAETVQIVITEDANGKLSVESVTGAHTTWNAETLTAATTITNESPTVDVTANKAWENADGTTTAPEDAEVTFTLYADGEAAGTVTLDGTADQNGESAAWTASFTGLPKYKVVEGAAVEIVYTVGETETWEGYELVTTTPVASGGTITNKQSTKWIRFVKTDTDGAALSGAEFTFDPGTGEVALTSGEDGILATSGTDSVDMFEVSLSDEDYTLAEEKAPDGYLPLTSAVSISVTADGVTAKLSDGTEFEVAGTGTQTDPYVITITNAAGTVLPLTGGIGTTGFYVLGMILVLGAAAVLFIRRRNMLAE